jgi:hypothetical protein
MDLLIKYHLFLKNMGEGRYDLSSDTLKIALTNKAPNADYDDRLDLVFQHYPPAAANGYPTGGYTVAGTGWSMANGVTTLTASTDITVTATAGGIGPFRYMVLYDDTPTSPIPKPLIGFWDYGESLTLNDGQSLLLDITNGLFYLA